MESTSLLRYRRLTKGWKLISVGVPVVALSVAFFQLFHLRPFGFLLIEFSYLYVLVAAFLPLCFLWIPISSKTSRQGIPWYDTVLAIVSAAAPLYFVFHEREVLLMGWEMGAPPVPFVLSILLWVLMIEAGRRTAGPVFATFVLLFSVWPIFASHMPGLLWAPDFSFRTVASFHALGEDSIIGTVLSVFGRIMIGFMVFSVVLQGLGAGKFFTDLAAALVGNTRAGNAKVAIVGSGLFGSISGSSAVNVMTTGAFTIPAMKKEGLPAHFAAAVEACASSGGVLLPPVMGAIAFIMAEFLEVSYVEVIIVAAVPAILYYMVLFLQIDSYSVRKGLKAPPVTVDVLPVWRILLNNYHIILGFVVLIFLLFSLRLISQGPWIATAFFIVIAQFRKETRFTLQRLVGVVEQIGRVLGELMGIMGPVGMIIGSFLLTGLAHSIPHEIVGLAGGNLYIMLALGAAASYILGMAVAMQAVYIFLAIVLAPGLVAGGFDLMAVHLFVMWCALWSTITPPVAMTAFIAAKVAGADPMRTGFEAMKLGIAKYILPFLFILNPALILRGPLTEILLVIPITVVGLIIISGALEGYFWRIGNLTIVARVLLFGTGMLVAVPPLSTSLYGIGASVVILGLAYLLRGRSPLANLLVHNTQPRANDK